MADTRLLKKDLFGEVRLISSPDRTTIVRDTESAPIWIAWLARLLLRREARVLAALDDLEGVPELIEQTRSRLVRSFIAGEPMQTAKPVDRDYYRRAIRLLRALHGRNVVHNDLAKEPNLLVTEDGIPAFLDFQLGWAPRRRGRLFRALAYEDLRHLLKHKRTYCPDDLSARQRRILENPSWPSRAWRRTVKPVYLFVTRRLLGWADREGAGDRGAVGKDRS